MGPRVYQDPDPPNPAIEGVVTCPKNVPYKSNEIMLFFADVAKTGLDLELILDWVVFKNIILKVPYFTKKSEEVETADEYKCNPFFYWKTNANPFIQVRIV